MIKFYWPEKEAQGGVRQRLIWLRDYGVRGSRFRTQGLGIIGLRDQGFGLTV